METITQKEIETVDKSRLRQVAAWNEAEAWTKEVAPPGAVPRPRAMMRWMAMVLAGGKPVVRDFREDFFVPMKKRENERVKKKEAVDDANDENNNDDEGRKNQELEVGTPKADKEN